MNDCPNCEQHPIAEHGLCCLCYRKVWREHAAAVREGVQELEGETVFDPTADVAEPRRVESQPSGRDLIVKWASENQEDAA